ncbi:hypothetical protein AB0P05_37140 [Streptomyces flaveolus]|uniref:hypothetical protein n=1 Tax=Streptomyces flaveolus TaxID=67297 RepID=UPI0034159FAB
MNISEALRFIIVPLAVPVVTALAGGLGLIWRDYRNERDYEHRSKERLEIATRQVDFITQWLQTKQLAGSLEDATAQNWLEKCYESAAGQGSGEPEVRAVTLRRIFLIGHLTSTFAQLSRFLYWLSLLLLNVFIVLSVWDIFAGFKDAGYELLLTLTIGGGACFLFASLCRRVEDSYRRSGGNVPPPWLSRDSLRSSENAQRPESR